LDQTPDDKASTSQNRVVACLSAPFPKGKTGIMAS